MSNKLPKRSILGTRVSAQWTDGLYYGGVIDSSTEQPNGQVMYNVLFDDGYTKSYFPSDIIGPGFSSVCTTKLKHKQTVYVTHLGREVKGLVIKHSKLTDEVFIELPSQENTVDVTRKLDEIRLLESRKSARLQEADHQDFSKLQLGEPRKRKGMDMPRKVRHFSEDDGGVTTAEHMAALVLTSLSCSPQSPGLQDFDSSPRHWSNANAFAPSPSPPLFLSSSAPISFSSRSIDEGIDVDMGSLSVKERETGAKYVCTWKGCGVSEPTKDRIYSHIRVSHLGPKSIGSAPFNEEEFYYTRIEENEISMDDFEDACSPPKRLDLSLPLRGAIGNSIMSTTNDHDYLKKDTMSGLARSFSIPDKVSSPISIPKAGGAQHFFAVKSSPYARGAKISPVSPSLSSSPKTVHSTTAVLSASRKSRSDVKKCRKVYGMENHDKWCTQCKWKKACTRFPSE